MASEALYIFHYEQFAMVVNRMQTQMAHTGIIIQPVAYKMLYLQYFSEMVKENDGTLH